MHFQQIYLKNKKNQENNSTGVPIQAESAPHAAANAHHDVTRQMPYTKTSPNYSQGKQVHDRHITTPDANQGREQYEAHTPRSNAPCTMSNDTTDATTTSEISPLAGNYSKPPPTLHRQQQMTDENNWQNVTSKRGRGRPPKQKADEISASNIIMMSDTLMYMPTQDSSALHTETQPYPFQQARMKQIKP